MKQVNLPELRRRDVPLHVEVSAVLRHQILSGELPPGAKLPALRELKELLGVARMTIIQAMNNLEEEGLIERHSGRGTFVKEVPVQHRHALHMTADISQLYSMVSQLQVDVQDQRSNAIERLSRDGQEFCSLKRTHVSDGKPFCYAELELDAETFEMNSDRFLHEIAVSVLNDLGVAISNATQKLTISYADFQLASVLQIPVNAAVFRVARRFYGADGKLIYSALLSYPGDLLELEIDFKLPESAL